MRKRMTKAEAAKRIQMESLMYALAGEDTGTLVPLCNFKKDGFLYLTVKRPVLLGTVAWLAGSYDVPGCITATARCWYDMI